MPPFYLSVPPFYFQDFGSSLLSLLWMLFQVLFPLHLFSLVGFYHVPLTAVRFSLFSFYLMCCVWDSPFCRLQGHSSSYVVPTSHGWGWTSSLWKFPGWCMELVLVFLKGSAMSSTVLGVSVCSVWLWLACLLMCRVVLLFCWRFDMERPALELASSYVELGLSVEVEAFWWPLIY